MTRSSWFFLSEDEYKQLNPPEMIIQPVQSAEGVQDLYVKLLDDDNWLPVGHIPTPKTRWGWFIYHLIHGLAMRYRLLPVLVYSATHSFIETPVESNTRAERSS